MAVLGEAGWITAGDGTREKDGQPLAFTISTLSGDTLQESIAAVLQEYWRQVGVEAEILAEQDTAYFERYDSHDFEVVIQRFYGQLGSQAYQFTCAAYDQGGNRQRYCNAEADELLNAALAEPDREARLNLLAEFQNIIMTELPVGPLFYDRGIGAVNPRAHNLYPNALNPNFNMETWWIGLRPYSSVKAGRA
jgi:peptide/nickel transport system substrate-binding protein